MKNKNLLSIGSWIGLLTMAGSFSLCHAEEVNALGNGAPVSKIQNLSFRNDIQPIFDANCVVCHMNGATQGGLTLESGSSYQALVRQASRQSGLQLISPAKPDESYLIHKLNGTHLKVGGRGLAMPMDSKLTDIVRAWVLEGTIDN